MNSNLIKPAISVIAGIVLLGFASSSYYSVDSGNRGVKLRNGAVISVSEPGLHFKVPLLESVKTISVRTDSVHYNSLQAYSRDQQPATISVSVTYHIPDSEVVKMYEDYGTEQSFVDRIISRQVPTQVENVFGQFNAITAVQDRTSLMKQLNDSIKASLKDTPVIIDSVQVENIVFSDAYEKSVESRMQAEVEVQTQQQKLQQEEISAKIAVARAQGEADSQLAKAKASALDLNPNIIEYTKVSRWNGQLPQTMVPGSALPFFNVKTNTETSPKLISK